MSYNSNGINILQNFYPISSTKSNTNIAAITTYFKINNNDISNNYVGIGTNSNIPVSYLYPNYNFFTNTTPIGDLFELNLPVFNGTINIDYTMFPSNGGLLIQILKSTTLSFRYNVNCSFCMVGGGAGGGYLNQSNAGGGGGAGELVQGSINGYIANSNLTITIGEGGGPYTPGSQTYITYYPPNTYPLTISAYGGGYGGRGKGSGQNVTGSSGGGSGSYSNDAPSAGIHINRTISNVSIFTSMISYGNNGALGNDRGDDDGAGGGGGGAGAAATAPGNSAPGVGGAGKTITYGSKSFDLAGGGGGGGRENNTGPDPQGVGGAGGLGGGGAGGGPFSSSSSIAPTNGNGVSGTANTGGGGGGGQNGSNNLGNVGTGGAGGSGTVIFYILPSGVSI